MKTILPSHQSPLSRLNRTLAGKAYRDARYFILVDENTYQKLRSYEHAMGEHTRMVTKDWQQSVGEVLYITSIGLGAVWICDLPKDRKIRKAFGIPANFDTVGYIAFGHPKTGDENSTQAMIYHYGDEASFREHKRRYTPDQVLCRDCFTVTEGDCTTARYPTRMKLLRQKAGAFVRRLTGKK